MSSRSVTGNGRFVLCLFLTSVQTRRLAEQKRAVSRHIYIYIYLYICVGTYVYVCNVYEKGKLRENGRGRRIKLQADTLGKFSNPTAIDCIPFAAHIDLLFPLSFFSSPSSPPSLSLSISISLSSSLHPFCDCNFSLDDRLSYPAPSTFLLATSLFIRANSCARWRRKTVSVFFF